MAKQNKTQQKKSYNSIETPWLVVFACLFAIAALASFPDSIVTISQLTLKASISQWLFSILLVVWCLKHGATQQFIFRQSLAKWMLTGLFLFATTSYLWAVNSDFFVYKWLLWLPAFIAFTIVVSSTIDWQSSTDNQLNNAFSVIFIVAIIAAAVGILQYLFNFSWISQSAMPGSLFANKNMAAHLMVLTLPIGFYLLSVPTVSSLKPPKKSYQSSYQLPPIVISIGIGFILSFVFYTTTRAAWLSMMVQLILLVIWFVPKIKYRKPFITIAVVCLILFNSSSAGITPFWQVSSQELASIVDSASNESAPRYRIWQNTLSMIANNPFIGSGFGSYFHNINHDQTLMSTNTFQRVHNDYLEIAVELGWLGLLLMTLLAGHLIVKLYQFLNTSSLSLQHQSLLVVSSIALIGISINALFSFPYQWALPPILIAFYLGVIVNAIEHRHSYTIHVSKIFWPLCSLFAILCLIVVSWVNTQWYQRFSNIEQGIFRQAKEQVSGFVHPDTITTLRILGFRLYHQRNYAANVQVQRAILDYWPTNYLATEHLAVNLRDMGQTQASLKVLEQLKTRVPNDYFKPDILQLKQYIADSNLEKLRPVYQRLDERGQQWLEQHPIYFEQLFLASLVLNDSDATPFYYQKTIKQFGKTLGIERNMAAFYLNNKRYQQAIPHIQNGVSLDKNPSSRQQYIDQMAAIGITLKPQTDDSNQ